MIGKIKFFHPERKFGFISVEGSAEEYYFSITVVSDKSVKCLSGEQVEFDAIESKRKPGTFEANNVRHREGYRELKRK